MLKETHAQGDACCAQILCLHVWMYRLVQASGAGPLRPSMEADPQSLKRTATPVAASQVGACACVFMCVLVGLCVQACVFMCVLVGLCVQACVFLCVCTYLCI